MKHAFDNVAVRMAGVQSAREFFQPIFIERDRELLIVALCDSELRLRQLMTFPGAKAYVKFSVVSILKAAVVEECAGLILAHNHPSGDTRPSNDDRAITRRVVLAADALDITVLDHLIFSGQIIFSFRERGLL